MEILLVGDSELGWPEYLRASLVAQIVYLNLYTGPVAQLVKNLPAMQETPV